jgi:2,4-dienoyl-CoA reductase-like NADH-dependent reductase (Old Yellow Enzyme family)
MGRAIVQVRRLRDRNSLVAHLNELGVSLPLADDELVTPTLAKPLDVGPWTVPNRFVVLPMEGWDGTSDGRPTELLRRRWQRFGRSGAGLIWGGEAVAVVPEGRANPNQLYVGEHSVGDLASLRDDLLAAHRSESDQPDPVIGLQLTHSGRWSRPDGAPAPRTAYRHPVTDARVGATVTSVLTDGELDELVDAFVRAAVVAQQAGFDFVDVKHCHGYLLHELLSAVDRPGDYGGSFEGRTRFLTRVLDGIGAEAPGLRVGVRLSAFDLAPHVAGPEGTGVPAVDPPYRFAFGGDGTGTGIDLTETHQFCDLLVASGISMLCLTAGSPYTVPHAQRPAYFPPSDGYLPPRDPLVEVARLLEVTRELTDAHPQLRIVASGLSYLQDWLPAVAAGIVAEGVAPLVGYGRGVLSYPHLPADVVAGRPLERRLICRTFSDCTTAPRNGMVSGCYPLDDAYRTRPERAELVRIKRAAGRGSDADEGAS